MEEKVQSNENLMECENYETKLNCFEGFCACVLNKYFRRVTKSVFALLLINRLCYKTYAAVKIVCLSKCGIMVVRSESRHYPGKFSDLRSLFLEFSKKKREPSSARQNCFYLVY